MSFRTLVKKLRDRQHPQEPPITLTNEGFSSQGTDVKWVDITEIRALKLDLLTWDEVRLVVALASGGFIEVSEEQPGFSALVAAIEKQFPSAVGWREQVIKPAFARNETVLFAK
jgi:hypothetical protein